MISEDSLKMYYKSIIGIGYQLLCKGLSQPQPSIVSHLSLVFLRSWTNHMISNILGNIYLGSDNPHKSYNELKSELSQVTE